MRPCTVFFIASRQPWKCRLIVHVEDTKTCLAGLFCCQKKTLLSLIRLRRVSSDGRIVVLHRFSLQDACWFADRPTPDHPTCSVFS